MKVGDLIKFKSTVKMCIYLGLINEMHTFWNEEYGLVELWEKKFKFQMVEVISESRR